MKHMALFDGVSIWVTGTQILMLTACRLATMCYSLQPKLECLGFRPAAARWAVHHRNEKQVAAVFTCRALVTLHNGPEREAFAETQNSPSKCCRRRGGFPEGHCDPSRESEETDLIERLQRS